MAQNTRKEDEKINLYLSFKYFIFHIWRGLEAHILSQLCHSLLCASNLSDARQGALLHLDKWCHLSLVFLSLKSRLCFVTLPDVRCVLFCFILDSLCDWWEFRKRFLPDKKHRDVVIHTAKDPDLSPTPSSGQLSIGSYGDIDRLQRGFANKIRQLQFGFCLLLGDTSH